MEPLVHSELEELRQDICANVLLIDSLPLLRAIKLLQEAHFAQQDAQRVPRPRRPPSPTRRTAGLVAALMLVFPQLDFLVSAL
jgi:hypothetical protein